MAMQGIDTILQHLANASGALERSSRPGIKEVKEAAGSAKIAADLLKASETFLSNGIYVICDEPAGAYVDPAEHRIEMPEATLVGIEPDLPVVLLPLPDLLGNFAQIHEEAQAAAFEDHLQMLWGKTEHSAEDDDPASEWLLPWKKAFDENRLDTFARLVFALDHRLPVVCDFPTDEEMTTWRAGYAAPLPTLPEEIGLFPTWDETDQLEEFDRRLNALADLVPEHIYPPWEQAWDADHLDAFTRLLAAEAREPKSFDVPTDEERAVWLAQFAPAPEAQAEPTMDPLEVFQALLDKLEEAGVKESCLKRKNWKKAERAWRDAFLLDTPGTIALLEVSLAKSVITWEVPAASPIPEEAF